MAESGEPKVGLALSGGGFRAAFFHLGVLARLAELGLLRRVEVISTVSGGSIVGAAYYLRLKWLLQAHPQNEITDQMYCDLVADVAERLRALVRRNVRGRIFLNPFKNFAMASRRYSRSDRIGDLYDIYLYNPAWEGERPRTRWGADTQIELRELLIQPPGQPEGFKPDEDNHLLSAKVPILLLNATSLNSGHHWRFEAVRMGEPLPDNEEMRRVVEDADKNIRLEQGYFEPREGKPLVTETQRDFPLALAVAASACVPGLFHPLAISDLYDGITVQLVDGGVQDNQGVQGLFDEDCTHLIVSDASLQLSDEEKPSGRVPGVMTRSMSIQADRIRDEQLTHVSSRRHHFALMHLRKGLTGKALAPGESLAEAIDEREGAVHCSQFGVDPQVQKALVLAALVALVAVAVINRESLFGWLGDDQPVWTAIAAFAVPAVIIGAYMATGTRGLARVPIDWLVGALIPVLLAPLLFVWAVFLLALQPLSGLVGRVERAATRPSDTP